MNQDHISRRQLLRAFSGGALALPLASSFDLLAQGAASPTLDVLQQGCPAQLSGMTPANVMSMLTISPHLPGGAFTVNFNSSNIAFHTFISTLAAYGKSLSVKTCKPMTGFKLHFRLYNTLSTVTPTGHNPPSGSVIVASANATLGLTPPLSPTVVNLNVPATITPHWWFLKIFITTLGGPAPCQAPMECFAKLHTQWLEEKILPVIVDQKTK